MKTMKRLLLVSISINLFLAGLIWNLHERRKSKQSGPFLRSVQRATIPSRNLAGSNPIGDSVAMTAKNESLRPLTPSSYWASRFETPEAMKLLLLQHSSTIDLTYRELFARLKITSDQKNTLRGLLAERMVATIAIGMNSASMKAEDIAELKANTDATFIQNINTVLGADEAAKVTEFDGRLADEQATERIVRAAEVVDISFAPEQIETLAGVLNGVQWANSVGGNTEESVLEAKSAEIGDTIKAEMPSLSSDQINAILQGINQEIEVKRLSNLVYASK